MQYMKKLRILFINVHNVEYILWSTYFCPNSLKIENQAVSTKRVSKKGEPSNLNLAESSEVVRSKVKLVCVNENIKNQSLIYVQVLL